jgi:hypothetical protein
MTNDEFPNDESNPKSEARIEATRVHYQLWLLVILSSLVIGHSDFAIVRASPFWRQLLITDCWFYWFYALVFRSVQLYFRVVL